MKTVMSLLNMLILFYSPTPPPQKKCKQFSLQTPLILFVSYMDIKSFVINIFDYMSI